jgi:uncharacterized damage-inducible protein DinB
MSELNPTAPKAASIKRLFERLASAPRQLFEVCSGASPERMAKPLAAGKWTPLQVIQHLIGCDREALLPRLEKMLAEDEPFLPAYDQDLWMQQYGNVNDHMPVVLLNEFARLREKAAVVLFDLEPEQWGRTGRHEERGVITVFDLCSYMADHDDHHRRQIALQLASDSGLNVKR